MASTESASGSPAAMPDLVIGIDFGMTGTAVAYAAPVDQNVSVLRDWPGSHVRQDKVPSIIAYQNDQPSSWGFDVNNQELAKSRGIKSSFKGVFDEEDMLLLNQDTAHDVTIDEVERWLTDYLQLLYNHVKESLKFRLPTGKTWETASIRHLFSYPTTWSEKTIQRYKKIAKQVCLRSSDESSSADHQVEASLDEAGAAVAYFFAESKLPNIGDNLMVADIGGGTCDVSIFMVKGYDDTSPKLFTKDALQGQNIGSTKIDEGFETRLRKSLPLLPHHIFESANDSTLEAAIETQIGQMVQSPAFLGEKCRYGAKPNGALVRNCFYVPVLGLNTKYNNSDLDIEDGRMKFDKNELFKPLFDKQCEKIWKQFECQIQECFPSQTDGEKMNLHVILAGGMGSSEYVRNYLEDKFNSKYAGIPQFTVIGEPQLAVCKGLVHDGLKQINEGGLFRYSAQACYGIAKNKTFDSVEWFLMKDNDVALSTSWGINRLVEVDSEGKISLQLVKTMEDVHIGWFSNKSKQLAHNPTVVGSLTDRVPHNELQPYKGLRRQKSKCQITVKVRLGRGAIKFEFFQRDQPLGDPLYLSEPWHLTPMLCEGKDRGSPRTPREWRLNGKKDINWGTVGTWLFGAGGLAVAMYFGLAEMKRDDEKDEDGYENTGSNNNGGYGQRPSKGWIRMQEVTYW